MIEINDEVKILIEILSQNILLKKIYLFGSFAKGTNTEQSDIDLYLVMPDSYTDSKHTVAQRAYRAIRRKSSRPVDIVIGYEKDFHKSLIEAPLEYEIKKTGVVVYEQ